MAVAEALVSLLPAIEGVPSLSKALTATKVGTELWEPIAEALGDKNIDDMTIAVEKPLPTLPVNLDLTQALEVCKVSKDTWQEVAVGLGDATVDDVDLLAHLTNDTWVEAMTTAATPPLQRLKINALVCTLRRQCEVELPDVLANWLRTDEQQPRHDQILGFDDSIEEDAKKHGDDSSLHSIPDSGTSAPIELSLGQRIYRDAVEDFTELEVQDWTKVTLDTAFEEWWPSTPAEEVEADKAEAAEHEPKRRRRAPRVPKLHATPPAVAGGRNEHPKSKLLRLEVFGHGNPLPLQVDQLDGPQRIWLAMLPLPRTEHVAKGTGRSKKEAARACCVDALAWLGLSQIAQHGSTYLSRRMIVRGPLGKT